MLFYSINRAAPDARNRVADQAGHFRHKLYHAKTAIRAGA